MSEQGHASESSNVVPGTEPERNGLDAYSRVVTAVAGEPLSTVQTLQRLMLGQVVGGRLPITLLRRDALVDVVAIPAELTTN